MGEKKFRSWFNSNWPRNLALAFFLIHLWIFIALVLGVSIDIIRPSTLVQFIETVDYPCVIVNSLFEDRMRSQFDWGDFITFQIYYYLISGSIFYYSAGYAVGLFIHRVRRSREKTASQF
ncbi:MAG: hypothetical protein AB1656_16115 [Candidatus Omnitrophota bacterium]